MNTNVLMRIDSQLKDYFEWSKEKGNLGTKIEVDNIRDDLGGS